MLTKLNVPISVEAHFDSQRRRFQPQRLFWSGREFRVTQLGLHHTYRQGRTLHHVFSVVSKQAFFRLELNSENLNWTLTEVSDGQSN
jgi:hypothetical protein